MSLYIRLTLAAALVMSSAMLALSPRTTQVKAQSAGPGRILASTGASQGGIIEFNTDGSNAVNLTSNTYDNQCGNVGAHKNYHPSASRDGRLIAFQSNRDPNSGGRNRIFVMNADGSNMRQLTFNVSAQEFQANDVTDFNPVISPDGGRIAFISNRSVVEHPGQQGGAKFLVRPFDIFVMNSDGTQVRQVTTFQPNTGGGGIGSQIVSAVWNPEGTRLAFRGVRKTLDENGNLGFHLVVGTIFADGTLESKLSNLDSTGLSQAIDWSPDGRFIGVVFGSEAQGAPPVRVIIYEVQQGSSPEVVGIRQLLQGQNLLGGPGSIRFSPDSQRFAVGIVTDFNFSIAKLFFFNIDGSGGTPVSMPGGASAYEPFWWQNGAAIPVPSRLELVPNPVVVSNGAPNAQLYPTLYDAAGNVIARAATAWRVGICNGGSVRLNHTGGVTPALDPNAKYMDQVCASNGGVDSCADLFSNMSVPNVTVPSGAGDARLTFAQVSASGDTIFTPINPPSSAGTPPTGYTILGAGPAYNITTTGTYTPPVTVCFTVSSINDPTEFARVRILHGEGGQLVDRTILAPDTPAPDFATRKVCARVNALSPFVVALAPAAPANTWAATTLNSNQVEIQTWRLANGHSYAKVKLTFPNSGYRVQDQNWGIPQSGVLPLSGNQLTADALVEIFNGQSVSTQVTTAQIYDLGTLADGGYTFNFRTSGQLAKAVNFTVSSGAPSANTIDTQREFVRWQYKDFLGREPDTAGWDVWTNNITKCSDPAQRAPGQTEAQCIDRQRETTSAAFFLSPEFQYTGYFVYRIYKGGLGRAPYFSEFIPDQAVVNAGIVNATTGQLNAAQINQNKAQFANQFAQRAEFTALYGGLSNAQYVDRLFQNTGVTPTAAERQALIDQLNANPSQRGEVLFKVVDGINVISEGNQQFTTAYGQTFYNREFNAAFVQMEYFGYMRRDPDNPGFVFWLGKLNTFGNYIDAQMVRSFVVSPEYRARFGQP